MKTRNPLVDQKRKKGKAAATSWDKDENTSAVCQPILNLILNFERKVMYKFGHKFTQYIAYYSILPKKILVLSKLFKGKVSRNEGELYR